MRARVRNRGGYGAEIIYRYIISATELGYPSIKPQQLEVAAALVEKTGTFLLFSSLWNAC